MSTNNVNNTKDSTSNSYTNPAQKVKVPPLPTKTEFTKEKDKNTAKENNK